VQKLEKLKIPQAPDNGKGPFLLEAQRQLMEEPAPGKPPEEAQPDGVLHERVGMLGDLKMEPLLEPQGAEDAGGVLHKAQVVENPDDPLF